MGQNTQTKKPFMTQAAYSAKDSSAGMERLSLNPILQIFRDCCDVMVSHPKGNFLCILE
jgi:hypothetical protein